MTAAQVTPSSGTGPGRMGNPLAGDLDATVQRTSDVWAELRGARLFLTGGTGFFGTWLLESFCWANDQLGLNAQVAVLTRNPAAFCAKVPHLANHQAVQLLTGDVRTFEFPAGRFSHVIHAATDAGVQPDDNLLLFDTIVEGTRRTLEFAVQAGAEKFLFTSSGAVYGRQPPTVTHCDEEFAGAPNPCQVTSTYGEGKRAAELLCAIYARQGRLSVKIARCFAFVGPYLPVDGRYAVGNFIGAALRGQAIRVTGSPMTVRSYMYAADMVVWLWTILVAGATGRPYNVGSDQPVTMAELAACVAQQFAPAPEVQFSPAVPEQTGATQYVPSTRRAAEELGLAQTVDLRQALQKYIRFTDRPWDGESR